MFHIANIFYYQWLDLKKSWYSYFECRGVKFSHQGSVAQRRATTTSVCMGFKTGPITGESYFMCVNKLTRNLMNGVCQRDQLTCNEIHKIRFQQTKPLYFKSVTTFRDKHYPRRSVRDALRICCFNFTISWKRYVFYRNGSVHAISFN